VHAAGVLGATLDLPGTSLLTRRADKPHEDVLTGVHATIVRPTGAPPWPALVFMNGATPDGRTHPIVLRLSAALARTGHLVFIPDLPGIAGGELSPLTLASAHSPKTLSVPPKLPAAGSRSPVSRSARAWPC
jgi:hypothetical protein